MIKTEKQDKEDEKMNLEKTVNYSSREAIIQNLKDAGCKQRMIKCFMTYLEQDNLEKLFILLEEHRNYLLSRVHEGEKQICCLDYLIYQIRRNQVNSENRLEEAD